MFLTRRRDILYPRIILILFITQICLAVACSSAGKSSPKEENVIEIRHAAGFNVSRTNSYVAIEINDPWKKGSLLRKYILIDRNKPIPDSLPTGLILRTPIRRLAVYSAVHAAMIEELGETDKITGVCEPAYISLTSIKEGIADKSIADFGNAASPNVEKIIAAGIEFIIATPFQNADYGTVGKIGIPIIEFADYMESTPLGRAEWIRLFGFLFNKEEQADSIFNETETRYMSLKEAAANATPKPTVFSEQKYGSSWYVPGSDSYVANLFRDAGASYIFDDIKGSGSVPLSFETVLNRAQHADFWLIKYNSPQLKNRRSMKDEYSPYEKFDAFQTGSIYICHTGQMPYYEETPIHPDYILRDYVRIFHPDILPETTLMYYEKIEN
jgi:iron complex transport system substrate-binding protein